MRTIKRLLKNDPLKIFVGLGFFIPAIILDHLGVDILPLVFYFLALFFSGISVFIDAVKGIVRLDPFDEKFLMSIASIGAFIIGEMAEGVAVMLFFLVGQYFEHKATAKARGSIKSLMEICPDTARLLTDEGEELVSADEVEIGSRIIVRPGERIPLDSVVISGEAMLDTSMLTGESMPRAVGVGDKVDSGVIVLGSYLTLRTERELEDSRAARVLALVEEATERKSREEAFITVFSRYYTPIVTVLALLMAVIPSVFSLLKPADAVYRALSFLVVSCPCALVISVPMAFFGGIGRAANEGILFKGGNVFSAVSRLTSVVFDKTGTLTSGELSVLRVSPFNIEEARLRSLVASAEANSTHPIARALRTLSDDIYEVESFRDIVGKGIVARVDNCELAVGNKLLFVELSIDTPDLDSGILVAVDGRYSGYISLTDTVKCEAKETISKLKRLGVRATYILSGDREANVSRVRADVGIDYAEAELLPEEKYERLVSVISTSGGRTAFVGDGINDAPSIAGADVGIAMGEGGTDSAIEAADVVIMSDNLLKIPRAIKIARRTVTIAKENIVFAIGIKLAVLVLASLNLAGMWLAVFADVGVAILAIMNSMRTMIPDGK